MPTRYKTGANKSFSKTRFQTASESQVLSPQALAQFRQRTVDVAQTIQAAGEWQTAGAQSGPRFE